MKDQSDTNLPSVILTEKEEAMFADAPPDIAHVLRRTYIRAKAKGEQGKTAGDQQEAKPVASRPAQVILFPKWPDERRATAAAVFRCALFPAFNKKNQRCYFEEAHLFSVEGVEVYFTGKQFDQSDLDVYLELLQIVNETPIGVECCFTAYSLLKNLGQATGKANHKHLHSQLIRLCAGVVDMTDHGVRYFGHLIEGGIKDEVTRHYRIRINPEFAHFFNSGRWASLDIQQRRALGRNQTAKALHAYYSTHAAPGPHRYETLAALVGLKNSNKRDSKANLIKAHEALKQVGSLTDYEAGPDTIAVKVSHTPSQARHVVKKIVTKRDRRGKKHERPEEARPPKTSS